MLLADTIASQNVLVYLPLLDCTEYTKVISIEYSENHNPTFLARQQQESLDLRPAGREEVLQTQK